MHTKSELVFENYCRERGYLSERIEPEVKAGRFPDYQLVTPAGPVIVEIKELTANDADRRFVETLNKLGCAAYQRSPGKRVFSAIKDAAPQLRRYKQTPFPEVLLLYDNIYGNSVLDGYWPWGRNEYLQPLDIAAGMFGSPVVRFWLDPDQKPVDATDSTHGGSRQLTETERFISARLLSSTKQPERPRFKSTSSTIHSQQNPCGQNTFRTRMTGTSSSRVPRTRRDGIGQNLQVTAKARNV